MLRICFFVFLSFSIQKISAQGLIEIVRGFTLERLITYEDVVVDWKMAGNIQAEFNDGLNFLSDKQANAAVGSFTRALGPDSSLWIAYYYRGVAFKQTGNLVRAEMDFKSALKLNRKSQESIIELGKTQQLQSKTDEAYVSYQKAVENNGQSAQAHYWLGEILLLKNELESAENSFTKCLQFNPGFAPARVKLALMNASKAKDPKVGLGHLNAAISKDSSNQESILLRALILSNIKPKEGIKDFNRLISINGLNPLYRLYRGFTLVSLKEYEMAFSDFQKVLQANAMSEAKFLGQQTILDKRIDFQYAGYYTLSTMYGMNDKDISLLKKAYCLLLVGNQNETIITLRKVTKYESSPLCLFLMAVALEHEGEHEEAWKKYESALKLDNTIVDAHKKVAIYNSNIGEWKKAESGFTEALKLNDQLNNIYKLRGVARYKQDNYKGAIQDFDRYLLSDSTDLQAKENRYIAYSKLGIHVDAPKQTYTYKSKPLKEDINTIIAKSLKQGDTLEAIRQFDNYQTSITIDEYMKNKSEFFFKLKMYDSAIIVLNAILKDNPSALSSRYLRTVCYSLQKKQEQAEKDRQIIIQANGEEQKQYFSSYDYFLKVGDTVSAKIILRHFSKKWPKYIDVYLAQAEIFAASKTYDSVIYMVDKVLSRKGSNPNYNNFPKAYYLKSVALYSINDLSEALNLVNKALNKMPDEPNLLFHKAQVLYKLRKTDDAQKIMDELKRMKFPAALKFSP